MNYQKLHPGPLPQSMAAATCRPSCCIKKNAGQLNAQTLIAHKHSAVKKQMTGSCVVKEIKLMKKTPKGIYRRFFFAMFVSGGK